MLVSVQLVPEEFSPGQAVTAVVVDVLRASSTLAFACAAGAARVIPVATPDEAFALRARHPDAWLCGEREGLRISGFDCGNSPFEYPAADVSGRTLIFASTNGSRAMLSAGAARRRVLGAFVNAEAVVEALKAESKVAIVCAGRLGAFAFEDAACAGWLCARFEAQGAAITGPGARLARRLAPRNPAEVRAMLQGCVHGRALRALGPEFARDVERCADVDVIDRAFEW